MKCLALGTFLQLLLLGDFDMVIYTRVGQLIFQLDIPMSI
jgi:hypothetical protein